MTQSLARVPSLVVSLGEVKVASRGQLITHALGSCICITAYSPSRGLGGMIHFLCGDSRANPQEAKRRPFLFGDLALAHLMAKLRHAGADPLSTEYVVTGGAALSGDKIRVGKQNQMAARRLLWHHKLKLRGSDLGGSKPRNCVLDLGSGVVTITTPAGGRRTL